jgi:hypothetical protein
MFVDRWVRSFEHPNGSYRDSKRLKFPGSSHEFPNPCVDAFVPGFSNIFGRNAGQAKRKKMFTEPMSPTVQKDVLGALRLLWLRSAATARFEARQGSDFPVHDCFALPFSLRMRLPLPD